MNDFLDKYNQVPSAQRWVLFLIVLALLLGAFYFFMISPTLNKIKGSANAIAATQQQINDLAAKKRRRQDLLKEIETLQVDLVRVQNQLPTTNQIPNLLQQIHDQARTAGLHIDRFERTTDVPRDHYVEIPVKMTLSGTYDQLANFLFYVGRLTRIVNVRDLAIKAVSSSLDPKSQDQLGQLKVTALGTTFRYKTADEAGANSGANQ